MVLSLASPAYVHMPVWIALNRPYPYYDTLYPYSLIPENLGGGKFEVRRNGVMPKPLEIRRNGEQMMINGPLNRSIARSDPPCGRLPLQPQYRFDVPGKYEIRFFGTRLEADP